MRSCLVIMFLALMCSFTTLAQPVPSQPSTVVGLATDPVLVPAPPAGTVPVAEPAAPPQWAEAVLVAAQKLPVVGPIVSKIILYLGIFSSILTALVAFLLTILKAISGIANLTGLVSFAEKLQVFRDGKIMYWLKYLSMFNAKKPSP